MTRQPFGHSIRMPAEGRYGSKELLGVFDTSGDLLLLGKIPLERSYTALWGRDMDVPLTEINRSIAKVVCQEYERHGFGKATILGRAWSEIKRPKRLKPAEIAAAAEAYLGGLVVEAVARLFGVSESTMIKHLHKAGVQMRPAGFRAVGEAARSDEGK